MNRATLTALVLVLASCRGRSRELEAVPLADEPSAQHVGALVLVDAFQFATCDLDALAFPTRTHGYVRDTCGSVYGTLDGGRSFVAVDSLNRGWNEWAPYPLAGEEREIEWHRFPEAVHVGAAVISIDPARRLLAIDDRTESTRLLAVKASGGRRERVIGMAASKFGLVAWTTRVVLGADGQGPLVARARAESDEIQSVVRPFEDEWLVRTKRGAILRSRKQGWIRQGEDPHALVPADDFDRWLLERAERAPVRSPVERGLEEGATITVSVAHVNCSDMHQAVTYSVHRLHGALILSIDDGAPRRLSPSQADELQSRLLVAWNETAIQPRWNYSSQPLSITVHIDGQPALQGRYTFPSPLARAVLSAFGE